MSLPRVLIRCLLTLAWVVSTAAMAAQSADTERWTGLSDTLFTHLPAPAAASANVFAQDGSGFLWIGTQAGLSRWDGYQFRTYKADPQTPGSLPDSYILSLHVDESGRLWIGTSAGGLARYDAERDTFVVYPAGPSGLSGASVTALSGDANGGLWVGTDAGLDHLDASGTVQRAPAGAPQAQGLPDGGVQTLLNDSGGALWVGTRHGLWRRERATTAFSAVALDTPQGSAPAVTRLYQDSAGRIWVGTRPHGAFVIEAGSTRPRAVRESGTAALQSDGVMAIVETTPGEMWLGTDGGGIVVVDVPSGSTRRIRHQADAPTSLSDDDVWALYRDRSGLVWVASNTTASRHDPQQRAIVTLLGATGRANGISHANVPFVLPLPDGRVWLSVGGGGIDIIDPLLGRVAQMRPDAERPLSALPKGRVLGMATGPRGEVYIGTQQGLYRSDSQGRRVMRLDVPGRSPTAAVWALCQDAGVLWFGGLDGLWALDLQSANQPALLRHEDGGRIGDARVTAIVRGGGTSLWIGTRSGLAHLDTISGAIQRVPTDAADPSQMPAGYVSSILVDARGRLWVSSFGSGIAMLERRDADGRWRFRRLGLREGLHDVSVNMLLEDRHGDIWASTDDGLAVIDASSFAIRALQQPQGVGILSYWTNAGAVTAAGELLFGGSGGLTVVRPERLSRWAYRAPLAVTDARVGNAPLPVSRLNQPQSASTPLEISPEDRGLWVEFSALDYSAPQRNRYAYRLEGFDREWITTEPTRRLASYTNLPPGHYTLQLHGSNRDGEWSQALHIPIRVLPAWYQTVVFRFVSALCALGLVGALVQARTVLLRRRQRDLQSLVAERTATLEQRSKELRESQHKLEQMAYADPLTGLPNRRFFDDELRHRVALALRDGGPFTLLLIDLDGFKNINDTLGHDAGDAVLVATAARLNHAVRDADRVARLGGDEFAVLLTQSSGREAVESICRRIVTGLAEPVSFNGASMQLSASIGAALCPSQGATVDALHKAADVALYEAKRGGRNTWRWYGQSSAAQDGLPTVRAEAA